MKKEDYEFIRNVLVGEVSNARSASLGARVQEVSGIIKRLDEGQTKGKKTKLLESEVKNEQG